MIDKRMIGLRIRLLRKLKNLTLSEFANAIGVTFQSAQQWEMGKTSPRLDKFNEIAIALETSPEFLILGIKNPDDSVKSVPRACKKQIIGIALNEMLAKELLKLGREDLSVELVAHLMSFHFEENADSSFERTANV